MLEGRATGAGRTRSPDSSAELDKRFGEDPFLVHSLVGGRHLTLLRGSSELVLTDSVWNTLSRVPTPRSPAGWAFPDGGTVGARARERVFVGGELSSDIHLFAVTDGGLALAGVLTLEGVAGVRDLTVAEVDGTLIVADDFDPRLIHLSSDNAWAPLADGRIQARRVDTSLDVRATQVRVVGPYLLINQLLAHRLRVVPLASLPSLAGAQDLELDGPIWSFDARLSRDTLWIVAGGAEDRPLDRTSGEFGFVDSFLYLYRLTGSSVQRLSALNLSRTGVVTPRAVAFVPEPEASVSERGTGEHRRSAGSPSRLWVSAHGSGRLVEVEVRAGTLQVTRSVDVPPGTTGLTRDSGEEERWLLANPLLDGVYEVDPGATPGVERAWERVAGLAAGERSLPSRLGELIFFTTLMTPENSSEGFLSRFTCETCHFEGTIDGRTHYTGRGHVFATTKTLRGLANNVPVFSRGGDATLTSMVLAEFVVANQRSPRFSLAREDYPWLEALEGLPASIGPRLQREALLSFLIDFEHRPNPARHAERPLSEQERFGLRVFRDRCSVCHKPLTSTRDGGRFVPFGEWEARLRSQGPDLVWGAPVFSKTGVEPYVSSRGARVPSLRRVWRKVPYFTDGSSRSLEDLLSRFRSDGPSGRHHVSSDRAATGRTLRPLSDREIVALLAVLRLF